jgi:hypothetical protein
MWGNIVAIQNVLKKKTTNLNSLPAQYEKNKIDKNNSRKKSKNNHKKIKKKTMWGNIVDIVAINSVFKKKTTKLNF